MGSNVEIIRNRPGEQARKEGVRSIVTIGNFDGLHLGHQALIRHSRELVRGNDVLAVVTFEPLPQALFQPAATPARLSTVYQKLDALRRESIDRVWLMRFDTALSRLSARVFAQLVIANGLAARHVVVGADFHFGHKREGDVSTLRTLGHQLGFEVNIVPAVYMGNARVSSSAIRQALAAGEFAHAAAMLGRPFRMEGHVIRGRQLGRTLGYATANLRIRARPCPLRGIFAVFSRVNGKQGCGAWRPAVANLGWRPTVGGQEPLLEAHVFDFDGDLYGQRLEVQFVAKLREEAHFGSLEELVAQMRCDEAAARTVLAQSEQPA